MTLREKAEELRFAGYSYAMIGKELNLSKSTMSNWLSHFPFTPNKEVIQRIGEGKLKSAQYKHKEKQQDIAQRKAEAVADVGELSERDIFMLGLGVYIGEGSKSVEEVRIVNTNIYIMKLALKWFKECCGVGKGNIKVTIHAYPDTDTRETLNFWSRELDIPLSQFNKTIVDYRMGKSILKERKVPYGTAHMYVKGKGIIKVKSLHRKVIGWIEAVASKI